ncbi:MAG: helix-turn-helix domain-containing protein [Ruminococcaceae bacterium]|nr:helix-turn-helix domain-containing protein [Oscillospiraceae bacterium]
MSKSAMREKRMNETYQKRGYLLESFRLFHMRDIPKEKVEYHYHEFYKLLIVLSGTGGYWIDGERYQLESGDVVLLDRRLIHRPEFEREYERVIIYISPEFLETYSAGDCDLADCFSRPGQHILRLPVRDRERFLDLVRELEGELASSETGKDILSGGLLARTLVELYRLLQRGAFPAVQPLRPRDARVAEMLRYIEVHLGEEISVETLAEHFFLSRYHMMRLFREHTGITIHAYIQDRRLMNARDLMGQGVGATEACYKAGFNSYCTFCRAYNRRFGRSPTGRGDRKLLVEETYE